MFKSVKKANSNQKNNMEQAALNPRPLRERVTRTCRVKGNKKQTCSITSRLFSSSLSVILERERSELSRGSRNIMAILFDEANSVFSRFLNVIAGRVPAILVQRVTNLVNKLAVLLKRSMLRQDSRDRLCVTPENDAVKRGEVSNGFRVVHSDSVKGGEVLKSALIITAFMLFSAAAQATVCFLPDGNCGDVNYGYKTDSSPNCTYHTSDEANLKKGECEEVKKQGFCYYLSCSMSKSECDKSAAEVNKCCVPCGNCWQVDDCVNPPIPTCEEAGYETEKTCKDKNQNFEPNGKFDKSGTACGTCKDVPYITCPEMGDYITKAECTAKGGSFTSANVKDSDGDECGTCDTSVDCPSGYEPAATADCDTSKGFYRYTNSNYPNCIQCQCRNQGKINGYCTNCPAEGYVPSSSLQPGYDCNIEYCPIDSSYVKTSECTETPCPTGYTKGLTSINMCSPQNGQSATSVTYSGYSGGAPCGKCVYPGCTPKTCDAEYRFVQSSFTSMDNTEECNPGCDGTVKYKCADGYTFTATSSQRYCKKDTPDCDEITRFKNVTDMAKNMSKICQGGTIAHDEKCYYCGKSCAQLYTGATSKCGENEKGTRVGNDDGGNTCYTCTKCYKKSSSGTIKNGSTIYYYPEDELYVQGECAYEKELYIVCDNTNQQAKLYIYLNGVKYETGSAPSNDLTGYQGKWYGSFMNCNGCASVTCTFKYGDKTTIKIEQTGGPGDAPKQ